MQSKSKTNIKNGKGKNKNQKAEIKDILFDKKLLEISAVVIVLCLTGVIISDIVETNIMQSRYDSLNASHSYLQEEYSKLREEYYNLTLINESNRPELVKKFPPASEAEIASSCGNLTNKETAECLVNQVKTFYKYHVTNDSIELTFEELKELGGDCKDYSELYQRLAGMIGFYVQIIDMQTSDGYAHNVALMSNTKGYCILDQTISGCVDFGTS